MLRGSKVCETFRKQKRPVAFFQIQIAGFSNKTVRLYSGLVTQGKRGATHDADADDVVDVGLQLRTVVLQLLKPSVGLLESVGRAQFSQLPVSLVPASHMVPAWYQCHTWNQPGTSTTHDTSLVPTPHMIPAWYQHHTWYQPGTSITYGISLVPTSHMVPAWYQRHTGLGYLDRYLGTHNQSIGYNSQQTSQRVEHRIA